MLAGLGVVDITPPVGVPLNGFIARLSPSAGVDLPLQARALWIEDGPSTGLLVSLDVLGLTPCFADRTVAELATALELREEDVILASSHTHSGPMTVPMRGIGVADEGYLSTLADRIRLAAAQAESSKRGVTVAWGKAPVDIGVNRRERDPQQGTVVLGRSETGPRDALVRVMQLLGPDVSIVLVEHACHPYCLGGDCTLISPDFWGHAAAVLTRHGHQTIYLNGCSGNIAPRHGFEGPDGARLQGEELAGAVLVACERSRVEKEPALRMGSIRMELPHDDVPPVAQIRADLQKADLTVRSDERAKNTVQARLRAAWSEWVEELERAVKDGRPLPPIAARLSATRIGHGAIIFLPGEVFFEIGCRVASRIAADPIAVAAYGHGYIGYVPTGEAFAEGGYEVEEAHRYVGRWRITPRAEYLIADATTVLWRRLGGQVQ